MKKLEPKDEILFVRVTKSVKDLISSLAFKRFGVKRKESLFVNEVFEEIRDFGHVEVRKGKEL